jgi:uncharacterized protein YceK
MKTLLIALTFLLVSGCATLGQSDSTRIMYQYATIKLIDNSSSITSQGVIDKVAEIRALADSQIEISPQSLVDDVLSSVPPAERFLIQSFVVELQHYVLQAEVPADQRTRLNTVLDWVEQAARLY